MNAVYSGTNSFVSDKELAEAEKGATLLDSLDRITTAMKEDEGEKDFRINAAHQNELSNKEYRINELVSEVGQLRQLLENIPAYKEAINKKDTFYSGYKTDPLIETRNWIIKQLAPRDSHPVIEIKKDLYWMKGERKPTPFYKFDGVGTSTKEVRIPIGFKVWKIVLTQKEQ